MPKTTTQLPRALGRKISFTDLVMLAVEFGAATGGCLALHAWMGG